MTREEITNSRAYQVSKAALEYYNEHHQDKDIDLTDAFEEGAKWADENPKEGLVSIDKVCEWLDNHIDDYGHDYYDELITDFRKAMEMEELL